LRSEKAIRPGNAGQNDWLQGKPGFGPAGRPPTAHRGTNRRQKSMSKSPFPRAANASRELWAEFERIPPLSETCERNLKDQKKGK
jgi:hypothetical protein